MYNDYNDMGYRPKKLTKKEILEEVKNQAQARYGCYASKVVNIQETRESIRHSCPQTGVIYLPMEVAYLDAEYGTMEVSYYMCQTCGKLYIAMGV